MNFSVVRIDDRLIHGQVVMGWTRQKSVNVILAVDDEVANDSMQCSLLKMATPPGVTSYIVTIERAVQALKAGKLAGKNIMLLVRRPETLIDMFSQGIEIPEVNIGNIRSTPERKMILSHVFATDEELTTWKKLATMTKLYAQILPTSPNVDFNALLEKENL